MNSLALVRLGGASPMGQQAYENLLRLSLERGQEQDAWGVREISVLPLRASPAAGSPSVRFPLRLVWGSPYALAARIGSRAYGKADLFHRLDLRCPPSGDHEVLTIHDLPPLRFADEGSLPGWAAESARRARAVICPSEFAAQEVHELLGVSDIHVIHYGIDQSRAHADPLSESELADLGLRHPLVLHAAGATERKNLGLLARAWPRVIAQLPDALLAMCGPPSDKRTQLFATVSNVRYLGHRSPEFMARLIRTADVVAVPSTYEGFGLPTLEAMVAGTPAVGTTCGAIPEIAGDGAILVAPHEEAFADALVRAIAGGPEIARLIAAGRERASSFSWERCAAETIAVYKSVLP